MQERFETTADHIAQFIGTPLFVIIQTATMTAWIIIAGIVLNIDPFPYILLTLLLSIEAIYLGCFILVSTNSNGTRHDHYEERDREHREELAQASAQREHQTLEQLDILHNLQRTMHTLTEEIHAHIGTQL